jgi:protein subunit release factor B
MFKIKLNKFYIPFTFRFYKNFNFTFSWKNIIIPVDKLDVSFSRSGGAGGQNVNKLNTKVEFRFNVDSADWIEIDTKERLKELYPNKINNEGEFYLTSQEHRTQEQNRKEAEKKLQMIMYEASQPKKIRIIEPFKESEHQKEKRIQEKKMRSKIKNMRKGDD